MKYIILSIFIISIFILAGCSSETISNIQESESVTLNVLGWIGYDEEALIKPFEDMYGVDVKVKTYIGGDEMFTIMSQSKNEYDVVVIDPEYIEKLHATNRLTVLNENDYDYSNYLKPFEHLLTTYIDGKLYAVVIRYGTNALVYNTDYFTEEEVQSYNVLWSEKAKGKLGVWDWYLPSMGVLSMANGNTENPYQLSEEQFESLKESMMSLKPSVKTITGLADLKQALANEDVTISFGVGTYLIAYDLKKQGLPIESIIPEEGGIMWIETLGIPTDAQNPEFAKKFIQYMQLPETQAILATLKAYTSGVPNKDALSHLTEEEKTNLKMKTPEQMNLFVSNLFVRELPKQQTEEMWQEAWQEFKVR